MTFDIAKYTLFQYPLNGIIIFNLVGRFESYEQKSGKNSQRNFGQCRKILIKVFL